MKKKCKKYLKYMLLVLSLIILFIVWYVYAWIKFAKPHYHSNFMMFINGERVDFIADKYSEDIWKCKIDWEMSPRDRVHLHENNQDTIHVHHEWVAWGHFFSNNWFSFWENFIINDEWNIFKTNEFDKLTYILNGKVVSNPFNRMIRSEDQLLINYWFETEEFIIKNRFTKVSKNAWEYNHKYDPWTCSWTNENSIIFLIKQLLHFNHH